MTNGNPAVEIGLVLYPGAQLATVLGLTDLFGVAGAMSRTRNGGDAPVLRVSHWRLDGGQIDAAFDTHRGRANRPTFLIIPPTLAEQPAADAPEIFCAWLREGHRDGATICSVCAGAYLLARTGLLSGRPATTHWAHAQALASAYPDIRVDSDRLIIDDGDIITAGSMMAWLDLGLKLIDRVLGPTVMMDTTRFFVVDRPGDEQRYNRNFSPCLTHGDDTILKVQHWLQAHGSGNIAVAAMAAQAGLGERTFLRRFHKATGLKPAEYYQHLRVGKAREMLELTQQTVNQIAWTVGYEDPGSFRKIFNKIVGLSPRDYRRRFKVAPSVQA